MNRTPGDATTRILVALATALGGVLALLLPALLITPDSGGSATLAVVTLACAALGRFGLRGVTLATRTGRAVRATHLLAVPVAPGRVTDPVHHPLRPRAPGLA